VQLWRGSRGNNAVMAREKRVIMTEEPKFLLSDHARGLLESARAEALRLRRAAFSPESILLGLVSQWENSNTAAALLLEDVVGDLSLLRSVIEQCLSKESQSPATAIDAQELLEHAYEEARRWGSTFRASTLIGSEHLLLVTLAMESSIVGRAFENLRLDLPSTKAAIRWLWERMLRAGKSSGASERERCPVPDNYRGCQVCGLIALDSVESFACARCGFHVWTSLDENFDTLQPVPFFTRSILKLSRYAGSQKELFAGVVEALPRAIAANGAVVWDASKRLEPFPIAYNTDPAQYQNVVRNVAKGKKYAAQFRDDPDAVLLFQKFGSHGHLILQVVERADSPPMAVIGHEVYLSLMARWLSRSRWVEGDRSKRT
jgi:Clp amino terminal domain, pathogenicity island component